jgi:glycerol uptake facilitator-like aquaporin
MYKGFPWRKVPMYICAQIAGGFVAALMVYAQYQQTAREVLLLLESVGKAEINFTPAGPAGALAIFIRPGVSLGLTFLNETMCTIFIAVLVFSVLDPSNFFVSFGGAPFIIGLVSPTVFPRECQ